MHAMGVLLDRENVPSWLCQVTIVEHGLESKDWVLSIPQQWGNGRCCMAYYEHANTSAVRVPKRRRRDRERSTSLERKMECG